MRKWWEAIKAWFKGEATFIAKVQEKEEAKAQGMALPFTTNEYIPLKGYLFRVQKTQDKYLYLEAVGATRRASKRRR